MNEAEKLKFLTKEQEVPTELIKELSSDGGVEGIKAALVDQGWKSRSCDVERIEVLPEGRSYLLSLSQTR